MNFQPIPADAMQVVSGEIDIVAIKQVDDTGMHIVRARLFIKPLSQEGETVALRPLYLSSQAARHMALQLQQAADTADGQHRPAGGQVQ